MLTLEECIALSELTEDEVLAIAEHEHIPQMAAVEMGNYLVASADGRARIKRMILDDLQAARDHGDRAHVATLKLVLKHFIDNHAGVVAD
jgi:S-ribosylhomocysteine lyase LuxS involved in autoinducer biosynthesis